MRWASGAGRRAGRHLRAGKPQPPGDEFADDASSIAVADRPAKGLPESWLDADGLARSLLHVRHAASLVMTPGSLAEVAGVMRPLYAGVMTPRGCYGQIDLLNMFAHETCNHAIYQMTCEQYESLIAETGNRCEVCGLHGLENPKRKLFIDHDRALGDWAVRGLLCNLCNTILGIDNEVPRTPSMASYLAKPWYMRMLADRGIALGIPEEPPIGSVVVPSVKGWARRRTKRGWIVERNQWLGPKSWGQLYYRWGPHNLIVVAKSK